MCFFPIPNTDHDSIAYRHGVKFFDCGACPECLRKRSNKWVLRSVYEAKAHAFSCMVTLTYDNFVRDTHGNIIGETPVNPDLKVNQRDIQLFIKRLRKWCCSNGMDKIKYLACAEYGSHTHRAHYHCILFGVKFPDVHYYKKSKRGNVIYMSNILTKLWSHGICTVDSIKVESAIARYCTKYCAKNRSNDTFMLCSQGIGLDYLMRDFNGINYMIDGREFTIPRVVWERYISDKYKHCDILFSPKYVNKTDHTLDSGEYDNSCILRNSYRYLRDNDPVYIKYLEYWQRKGEIFESLKVPIRDRILQLDDSIFHAYKIKALDCLDFMRDNNTYSIAPLSKAGISYYFRRVSDFYSNLGILVNEVSFLRSDLRDFLNEKRNKCDHLPFVSRPNKASDTIRCLKLYFPSIKLCFSDDFFKNT